MRRTASALHRFPFSVYLDQSWLWFSIIEHLWVKFWADLPKCRNKEAHTENYQARKLLQERGMQSLTLPLKLAATTKSLVIRRKLQAVISPSRLFDLFFLSSFIPDPKSQSPIHLCYPSRPRILTTRRRARSMVKTGKSWIIPRRTQQAARQILRGVALRHTMSLR